MEIVHSITSTTKHTIRFDTKNSKLTHLVSSAEDDNEEMGDDKDGKNSWINEIYQYFFGGDVDHKTGCESVDLDSLHNCIPADCSVKYNGYRNYFNALNKMCEKVPVCSNQGGPGKQHIYYDASCNCCKELSQSLDEMEMISLVKTIQDSAHQIHQMSDWQSNYPKVKLVNCVHGIEVFGGLSCDCDDKWTTYPLDSRNLIPGKDVVNMCDIPVSKFTTTLAPPLFHTISGAHTKVNLEMAGMMDKVKSIVFGPLTTPWSKNWTGKRTNKLSLTSTTPISSCPCGAGSKIPKEICSCPAGFAAMIPEQLIPEIMRMYGESRSDFKNKGQNAKVDAKIQNIIDNLKGSKHQPISDTTAIPDLLVPDKDASLKRYKIHIALAIVFVILLVVAAILAFINWTKYFGTPAEKEKLLVKSVQTTPRQYGIVTQDCIATQDDHLELKNGDLIVEIGPVEKTGYMTGISLRLNRKGIFPSKNVEMKNDLNATVEAYFKKPPTVPAQIPVGTTLTESKGTNEIKIEPVPKPPEPPAPPLIDLGPVNK